MQLRVGAATDTGRVRELNEDVYRLQAELGLFVVCDGMGGAPAGEVASAIAAESILEQLTTTDHPGAATSSSASSSSSSSHSSGDESGYLPRTRQLAAAVRRSNEVIYEQSLRDARRAGMGTTMVGAWIAQDMVSLAHVGDSRAYLWHADHLVPLTRDHSLVEAQIGAGLIDREEGLQSDQQNVLVRALGQERDVEVELAEVPVRSGDYVLLCSDGLTRMVPDSVLAEAFGKGREPQRICDELVAAANRSGGRDNITVVVVEVAPAWWRRLLSH